MDDNPVQSWRGWRVAIVGLVLLVMVIVLMRYGRWHSRVRFLRFAASRQAILEEFGTRIVDQARADGVRSVSLGSLLDEGSITLDELHWVDADSGTVVRRYLRPVIPDDGGEDLAIVIECYDYARSDYRGTHNPGGNVFYQDGRVAWEMSLERVNDVDRKKRQELSVGSGGH